MEVASVHALAEEVKVSEAVALADHERIRRGGWTEPCTTT